ncbi:MAG: hypothetical protein II969_04740 [Anaerolineaceae bacterium]|nr:hypothetical protein [Anaerolineaceae bacterium]
MSNENNRKITYFILILVFCLFLLSAVNAAWGENPPSTPAPKETQTEKALKLAISTPGKVLLTGDFSTGDTIKLYLREYKSAEKTITDKLLSETKAGKDGSASLSYNIYSPALSEEKIKPDFTYKGGDVTLTALYAVIGGKDSNSRSNLVYISGFLDTGVVSQYWCTYGASTACGAAAGAIVLQQVDPVYGNDMYNRVNTMRNYCMDGDDYCTGYPMYEDTGEQVANTVNRYISEEMTSGMSLINHRKPGKSTEETLIELLTTGRSAVIEVCYLRGFVMEDYWGYSHFITINGFFLEGNGYWFRYSDPVTVSYASVSSDMIEKSNKNVSYIYLPGYTYDRYIAAFADPLFSIE